MAWCFDDEANPQSDKILMQLKTLKVLVPNIWALEVMNVLRVGERKKRISFSQSNTFMNLLSNLPIEIDDDANTIIHKRILDISREYDISSYDAAYLELALRKNIPFISFDKALMLAAKKAHIHKFE